MRMPLALMSRPMAWRLRARRWRALSAALVPMGSRPASAICLAISGERDRGAYLLVQALDDCAGVFAGSQKPSQVNTSRPG
jgi:hypothetical protein